MSGGGPYRLGMPPPGPGGPGCPRCPGQPLREDPVGRVAALRCLNCRGAWLDVDTFVELTMDPRRAREVLDALPGAPVAAGTAPARCPRCTAQMQTRRHASSGQVLDLCARHGVWFDPGELRAAAARLVQGPVAASVGNPTRLAPPTPSRRSLASNDDVDTTREVVDAIGDFITLGWLWPF